MLVYAICRNEDEALGRAITLSMKEAVDLFISPVTFYKDMDGIPFDESIDLSLLEDGRVYCWVVDEDYVENTGDPEDLWCRVHYQGDQVAVKLGGS